MSSQITPIDVETKILKEIDNDITLYEDTKGIFKRVLQYNPVSKVYIVIRFDTVKQNNAVLCLTTKPTVAVKVYNDAF